MLAERAEHAKRGTFVRAYGHQAVPAVIGNDDPAASRANTAYGSTFLGVGHVESFGKRRC